MSRSVNLCALALALVLTATCAIAQNQRQRIIKVCTLNNVQANEEFNRNVQIMQAQRQLLVSKHNALKAIADAEARETIQVEIDELLAKINTNNKKMYATYGFSLTRNYTIEPDESFVFMLVSDDEAAKGDDDDFDVVLSEAGRILRDWIATQTPDKRLVDIEGITKSTTDPRIAPAAPSQAVETRIH